MSTTMIDDDFPEIVTPGDSLEAAYTTEDDEEDDEPLDHEDDESYERE